MAEAEQYLSDKQVAALLGVHRVTPWTWARNGTFPSPVKLGGITRWKLSDIEAWAAEHEGKEKTAVGGAA